MVMIPERGKYICFDADAAELGIAKTLIMVRTKEPRTIGWSGSVLRFDGEVLGKFVRAITISGISDISLDGLKHGVNSLNFLKTLLLSYI